MSDLVTLSLVAHFRDSLHHVSYGSRSLLAWIRSIYHGASPFRGFPLLPPRRLILIKFALLVVLEHHLALYWPTPDAKSPYDQT